MAAMPRIRAAPVILLAAALPETDIDAVVLGLSDFELVAGARFWLGEVSGSARVTEDDWGLTILLLFPVTAGDEGRSGAGVT